MLYTLEGVAELYSSKKKICFKAYISKVIKFFSFSEKWGVGAYVVNEETQRYALAQWATPDKLGGQNCFMIGSGRGGLDKKKNVWGVWVGNAPLGRYGENTVFLD